MGESKLSAVEAELYDRQIRLWGIESQERLRAANVLLINIRGLGSEIAKNILLSGINSLTILDDGVVTEENQLKNFLLSRGSIGKKIAEEVLIKAQSLNPLVKIVVDTSNPYEKDAKFFESFSLIVATEIKADLVFKIDKISRAHKIKFIYGDVFGLFGFSVSDFQDHEFYYEKVKFVVGKKRVFEGAEKESVKVKSNFNYPELNKVLILPNTKQNVDSIKKVKRRNPCFFLMLTLIEFRNKTGRNPEISTKDEDISQLKKIKSQVFELYGVDPSKLSDEVFDLIFDQVVPACAIMGGTIAQEVIKAISQNDVPIHNVFLFDPISYCGKEETVA